MGKDLMQAVEAVADAQTGELERLKEFGITKEMIVRRGNQLGVQTVNNQGQIVDQKAFNAALFAIMQERYRGGMEIQSRSWKGMLSNVSDFVGRVGRKLGTPLFDALGKQVQRLLVWFDKLESSGQLDRWITNVVTVARIMGNVFGFIFRVVGPFLPLILSMVAAYKAYHTTIMIITAVTKLWTITQAILNGVMLLNPIGLVVAGIMLLIGVGIMLIMNWKKIVAWLSTAWQWIKNTAVNTFNSLVAFFKKWGLLIIGVIVNPFGTLGVMLLKTILNGIKKIAPNLYNSVKDVFMKIRRLLPFSDAKEGPFKDLTLSGKMTMHTLANGVRQGQGEFHKAMSESFEGTTGKTSPIGNTGAAAVGTSRPSVIKKINIQNLVKELKIVAGDKDGKQLSDEFVNALYDLLKNASDILQNGDLGEVL
jgi:hypothetical protein